MAKVTIGILGLAIVGMLYLYSLIFMGIFGSNDTSASAASDTLQSDNVHVQQDNDTAVRGDNLQESRSTTDYDIQTNDNPGDVGGSGVSTPTSELDSTTEERIKAYFNELYPNNVYLAIDRIRELIDIRDSNNHAYQVMIGTDGIALTYYLDSAGVIYDDLGDLALTFSGSRSR
jgi:hypothetical protein